MTARRRPVAGRNVWRNWGRNVSCRPACEEIPSSELEVVEALRRARDEGQRVKVVGSGHSFTPVACTDGRMLSLSLLNQVLGVDEAGIPIFLLNAQLAGRGMALANLGDIDRQSMAGAIATGTHGTGRTFGGLATFVRDLDLITADGERVHCSPAEEPEVFHAARVGLGALGVVTRLTLQCVPAFNLHHVERPRRFDDVVSELDEAVETNDHFEFYWLPHTDSCSIIANNHTDEPAQSKSAYKTWRAEVFYPNFFFGALVAVGKRAPSSVPRIAQLVAGTLGATERVGRSDDILVSRRLLRFVEMEYAIPREDAVEAVRAVRELIADEGHRVSFPIEVRFVAADDIPLSTANGSERCYIAVHMYWGSPYEQYFRSVEAIMDSFGGRPHWGKVHFQSAATLAPRYPEWARFAAVRARLDPDGVFANDYLDRVLGPQ